MFSKEQAAVVKGMLARGDKQHDIAAHFGENAGRIIDVKFGEKYADVIAAPPDKLPPPYRPPGVTLLDATMLIVDQIGTLEELIQTTPPGSPSVVLELCPELSIHILEARNKHNRDQRPQKIKLFIRALQGDPGWFLTGDTVKFGSNGELLDGQNRLRASILANIPIRTHVVFGIDPKAFAVLDSGAGRTSGDTFKVAGVRNHGIASKATRWLMIFDNPKMDRGVTISNPDLFDYYIKRVNKDLLETSIQQTKRVKSRSLPKGALSAMLYLFTKRDAKTAAIMVHDLERKMRAARCLIDKIDWLKEQTGSRVKETIVTALTVRTWNSYRDNNPIKRRDDVRLRWTDDELHPTIE